MRAYIPLLLLLVMVTGCSTRNTDAGHRAQGDGRWTVGEDPRPLDARPAPPTLYHLEVHQLKLPYGAVSQSEEFWKRVDERAVELETYSLLYRNGVRVGQAPIEEWEYFHELVTQHPVETKTLSIMTISVQSFDLEMQKDVEAQEIFFVDRSRGWSGRSYDRSHNLMSLSFQPAVRRPGDVRVTLVPTVRSVHRRFEVRGANEEREIVFVSPQRLFDLNLVTEIPPDQFLIVAPSAEARWPMSIGNRFFISESETERFEQVILLVPQTPQVGTPVDRQALTRRR